MRWTEPIKRLTKLELFSLVTGTVGLFADAIALTVFGAGFWGISPPPANVAAVALAVLVLLVLWVASVVAFFRVKRSALFDRRGRPIVTRSTRRVRRLGLCGMVGIPVVALLVLPGWAVYQCQPPQDIIILVTRIDGPEPERYRVTENILQNLNSDLANVDGVRVEYLPQAVSEGEGSQVARTLGTRPVGSRDDASVVIWGWYGATTTHTEASLGFEVLRELVCEPQVQRCEVARCEIAELDSYTVQGELSADVAYISAFVSGMVHYGVGNYAAADQSFTKALSQSQASIELPDRGSVLFYRANARSRQNLYQGAIIDLTEALRIGHEDACTYNNRGNAYSNLGQYEDAIDDYTVAISLDETFDTAYYNRAHTYAETGDYEKAIADYTKVIEFRPDDACVYTDRGLAFHDLGQYQNAIDDFSEVIVLDPNDGCARNNRGFAYSMLGEYEAAIGDYNEAIRLDPALLVAYRNRATAYYNLGEYELAIANWGEAIQMDPADAGLYHNRGVTCFENGEDMKAIADLTEAIRLDPMHYQTYYYRGCALRNVGEFEQSIEDFESYLRLAPSLCDACRTEVQEYIDEMRAQR